MKTGTIGYDGSDYLIKLMPFYKSFDGAKYGSDKVIKYTGNNRYLEYLITKEEVE